MATSLRACSKQLLQLVARRYSIAALSGSDTTAAQSHSHATHPCHQAALANQMLSLRRRSSSGTASGPSAKAKANGRRVQVMTGAATAFFGASYVLYRQLSAKEEGEKERGAGEEAKQEEVFTCTVVVR